MAVRPEIFISAASADLRSAREIIRDALLRLDAHPIVQEHFDPSATTIREMLAERLRGCDAVIHLVGQCAGSEPTHDAPDSPRRSYTQLEFDIARELGLPLYIFLCDSSYPFDEHPAETPDLAELQQAHRQRIASSDYLYTKVSSPDELGKLVREIPILRGRRVGAKLRFGGCAATLSIAFVLLIGGLAVLFNPQQRADPKWGVTGNPTTHRLTPIPGITPPFNPMVTPSPLPREDRFVASPGQTPSDGVDQKLVVEAFRRIDAAPELSNQARDELYQLVNRARGLQRVATLSFEQSSLEPDEASTRALEDYLRKPLVRPPAPPSGSRAAQLVLESRTEFIVFGCSGPETDAGEALRMSRKRAENIARLIKTHSPASVVHEVALGNSMSLGSAGGSLSANDHRPLAEVWAVVP